MYMRRDFFDAIGAEVMETYCHLGRVLSPNGEVYTDFISYRPKYRLVVRGDATSFYKVCATCGLPRYFPLGKRYLLRRQLTGAPIYDGDVGPLIISVDLYEKIRQVQWKKVAYTRLPVLDEPIDGHGDLIV